MTRTHRIAALAALVLSALALALAPLLMPSDYSWIAHTTSESAAQEVRGAWLARTGFVLFGLAVAAIAIGRRSSWHRAAVVLHLVFAVSMVGAAAFSAEVWREGARFDETEAWLHSLFATLMGFAFTFALVIEMIRDLRQQARWSRFTVAVAAAATLLSVAMEYFPPVRGVLQRTMFAFAYLWYAREAAAMWSSTPQAK